MRSLGLANGFGTNAMFRNPSGLAVMSNGKIYVADNNQYMVRVVNTAG
jgi:hypothetical protein